MLLLNKLGICVIKKGPNGWGPTVGCKTEKDHVFFWLKRWSIWFTKQFQLTVDLFAFTDKVFCSFEYFMRLRAIKSEEKCSRNECGDDKVREICETWKDKSVLAREKLILLQSKEEIVQPRARFLRIFHELLRTFFEKHVDVLLRFEKTAGGKVYLPMYSLIHGQQRLFIDIFYT